MKKVQTTVPTNASYYNKSYYDKSAHNLTQSAIRVRSPLSFGCS
jgi:hypothetical protein